MSNFVINLLYFIGAILVSLQLGWELRKRFEKKNKNGDNNE